MEEIMHPSDPETVIRRLIEEGFTGGRLEIADELVADHVVEHQDFGPGHADGPEGVKAVIRSLRCAFSDFELRIEDVVVDGDTVWVRNLATGTNDGRFLGFEPTGRRIRVSVFDMARVVDGRIVEHWGVPDRLGVLFQLGLFAPPAAVAA